MLATMSPSAHHFAASSHQHQLQPRHAAQQSTGNNYNSNSSNKNYGSSVVSTSSGSSMNSSTATRSKGGKRQANKPAQPKSADIDVAASNTPGLLTLSKPSTDGADSTQQQKAARRTPSNKKSSSKASTTVDESLQSAPLPPSGSSSGSALTWQQELLASSKKDSRRPQQGNRRADNGTKNNKKALDSTKAESAAAERDPLNWQQELYNSSSKAQRGPHFDVFADARDEQTFGPSSSPTKGVQRSDSFNALPPRPVRSDKKSKRAPKALSASGPVGLSVDDIFNTNGSSLPPTLMRAADSSSSLASPQSSLPATPNKKVQIKSGGIPMSQSSSSHLAPPSLSSSVEEAAYAGPDFHNSPSAASLPAPKFKARAGKVPKSQLKQSASTSSHLSTSFSSSSSGSEDEVDRSLGVVSVAKEHLTPGPAVAASSAPVHQGGAAKASTPKPIAPAPTQAPVSDKSTTIEHLLARMMGNTSL